MSLKGDEADHIGGVSPVVLVHGGAWAIPDDLVEVSCVGVQNAARAGYCCLKEDGGTALDAVVAAVSVLEDDPAFDAGWSQKCLGGVGVDVIGLFFQSSALTSRHVRVVLTTTTSLPLDPKVSSSPASCLCLILLHRYRLSTE